jgi:hypothetical protein
MDHQQFVFRSKDSAHGGPPARFAGWFHLLTPVANVGRAGHLAAGLAEAAGLGWTKQSVGLGRIIYVRDDHHRERMASGRPKQVAAKIRSAW